MKAVKFNVIQDTREQNPWKFTDKCVEKVVSQKLDYGDYALQGYQNMLWIERKGSVSEIANNMFEERFERLLHNVADYPYKYIICEFSMDDVYNYPYRQGLPKSVIRKIRVRGKRIMSYLAHVSLEHYINIVYAYNANYAQHYATSLMKNMLRVIESTEE